MPLLFAKILLQYWKRKFSEEVMLEKLQAVENRYEELCFRSEQSDFYADPKRAAAFLREKNELEPIVETFRAYNRASRDLEEAQELMSDPEMRELCQETFLKAKTDQENLYRELQVLLLPKDPNDGKNVIMEIRGGVGGEESALFADVLHVRRRPGLENRADELQRNGTWRREGGRFRDLRGRGLFPAEIRIRRSPGPAGAGDGIRGPGPHVHGHRGRAAGNGGSGRDHPPGGH